MSALALAALLGMVVTDGMNRDAASRRSTALAGLYGVGFMFIEHAERLLDWFPRLFFVLVIVIAGSQGLGLTHVVFMSPRDLFMLGIELGDHTSIVTGWATSSRNAAMSSAPSAPSTTR